jgi:hypothetical protein
MEVSNGDHKPETCGRTDGGVMRPAPSTRSGDRRGHETRAELATASCGKVP